MAISAAGVSNYANTSTGAAANVVADVSSYVNTGINTGGEGVCVAYTPAVPATAIYDRAGATILDRAGAYIQVR